MAKPIKVDEKIDPTVPLVARIWATPKKDYLQIIHKPQVHPIPARFFAHPFLEFLSRTPWWFIPLIWGPAIGALLWTAAKTHSALTLAPVFAFGIFIWTLVEYVLHRWLFHLDEKIPNHPLGVVAHFLLHGVHHMLPMDRYRLVFPPITGLPIGTALFFVVRLPFYRMPFTLYLALFAGLVFGYVMYDLFHYFSHHGYCPRDTLVGFMKSYHMKHHYLEPNLGFGITNTFWDHVFGTVLRWESTKAE